MGEVGEGQILYRSVGLGKEDGKFFVVSPKLLEEQGLVRKRIGGRLLLLCRPWSQKSPFVPEGGWPILRGGRVGLGPEACSLGGGWTMGPLWLDLEAKWPSQ